MMKIQHTWESVLPYISEETTHTTLRASNNVRIKTTIEIDMEWEHGWFEFYDIDTGGNRWHAEGELEVDEHDGQVWLVGYDGIFELPQHIIDKLKEFNVKIDL